jgi:hypothetical protein
MSVLVNAVNTRDLRTMSDVMAGTAIPTIRGDDGNAAHYNNVSLDTLRFVCGKANIEICHTLDAVLDHAIKFSQDEHNGD